MADPRIVDASFKGLVFHVATPNKASPFGVISQEITNERRLQISEKPMVDGAEVEDFGRKPRIFSAEVIFFGDNFLEQLKSFEAKLNEGTSGILILPDIDQAVFAKYQKHTRKSSAQDGNSTMLSVSWVEDRTTVDLKNILRDGPDNQKALNAMTEVEKVSLVQESTGAVKNSIDSVGSLITDNIFLKQLNDSKNSITSQRQTIGLVSNLARDTKALILNSIGGYNAESSALRSTLDGLLHLTDILLNDQANQNPTRYNTGLGLADFVSVGTVTTAVVGGNSQVVTNKKPADVVIQSYEDASNRLKKSLKNIKDIDNTLKQNTQGATDEISKGSIVLINTIQDLIKILDSKATRQILTDAQSSLLEICFRNGLKVKDIDRIQKINTQIDDILDVPRFTIINL